MLESTLEGRCRLWALSQHSVKSRKLYKSIGDPDRIFFKAGKLIFVEFKRPGEKPRAIQVHVHNTLRLDGFDVFVIDNFEDFKKIIIQIFS